MKRVVGHVSPRKMSRTMFTSCSNAQIVPSIVQVTPKARCSIHTFCHGVGELIFWEPGVHVHKQKLTTKDCKGLQTNIPKNAGSIKT